MSRFTYVIVFFLWLVATYINVGEIANVSGKTFRNVTRTELVYDQNYQHYYVEIDGVRKVIDSFSEPRNSEVSENHRVMADGKDVVCFKYYDDELRVYPKEEFDIRLKAELYEDKMVRPIFKLMVWTLVCCFLVLYVYKQRNG